MRCGDVSFTRCVVNGNLLVVVAEHAHWRHDYVDRRNTVFHRVGSQPAAWCGGQVARLAHFQLHRDGRRQPPG